MRLLGTLIFFGAGVLASEPSLAKVIASGERLALVMGNSDYPGRDRVNGAEGAEALEMKLRSLRFDVIKGVPDGDFKTMKAALEDFAAVIKDRKDRTGLIFYYFSGHGFQLDGRSYLLPIHSTINPDDTSQIISVDDILSMLTAARDDTVKLVFLDACRENADLPTADGGRFGDLRGRVPGLSEHKPGVAIPNKTLLQYSAYYGQIADRDSPGKFSLFTYELLNNIGAPGVGLHDAILKVRDSTSQKSLNGQRPSDVGLGGIENFPLHPPAGLDAVFERVDDNAYILLNGEIVFDSQVVGQGNRKPIELNSGINKLAVLVFNQKGYRNSQSWERPEGWFYRLKLYVPDDPHNPQGKRSHEIALTQSHQQIPSFAECEDVPFKDGSHHGRLFMVAKANIRVDPDTARVSLDDIDTQVWRNDADDWARDQELLCEEGVPQLMELPFLGISSAMRQLFFVVHGNRRLKLRTQYCMTGVERKRRLEDLRSGIWAAVTSRDPIPFARFADGLNACVGSPVMAVLEDRSKNPTENCDQIMRRSASRSHPPPCRSDVAARPMVRRNN